MLKRPVIVLFTVIGYFPVFHCNAETFFIDNSLSILRGNSYKVGDDDRTVATFEHLSIHSWGDIFLFLDRLKSDNGDYETYTEISPRITPFFFDDSFVKSIGFSTTFELGEDFTNTLWGGSIDLNLPGFQHFALNFYRRVNEDEDDSYQLTPTWSIPFKLGKAEFLYDGFADWYIDHKGSSDEINFTSQLKYNAGRLFGIENKLYVGVEYVYWLNKFGIRKHADERNLNLLAKYHF